ncbi:MAG: polysaccharide biosynthesis C-terminal domain-containing protein [Cytophagales bacterium]|nr:polysaccharide biosynthesis C-terminal domain-containing protein [Cytophaga sp.]
MKKLRLFWLLLCASAIVMLIFSSYIYKIWIDEDVIVPFSISATMAAYVILNAWNGIYSQFLNGVGKIKLQLYSAIGGSLLNIPFSIYLGQHLGLYGVILSTVIISLFNAFVIPIQFNKLINHKARGIWAE